MEKRIFKGTREHPVTELFSHWNDQWLDLLILCNHFDHWQIDFERSAIVADFDHRLAEWEKLFYAN